MTLKYNPKERKSLEEIIDCQFLMDYKYHQENIATYLRAIIEIHSNYYNEYSNLCKLGIGLYILHNNSSRYLDNNKEFSSINFHDFCEDIVKNNISVDNNIYESCLNVMNMEASYLDNISSKHAMYLRYALDYLKENYSIVYQFFNKGSD